MARMSYTWSDTTREGTVTVHTGIYQGAYHIDAHTPMMNGVITLSCLDADNEHTVSCKVSLRDSLPGLSEKLRQARLKNFG